jgi:phosphonate transport system substrate-binding protein
LNSAEDVIKKAKELTFSNGDPNSTSGFLVPGYYVFAQNNLDPKTAFKRTITANHETNALAVANKQVDVATNNSENLTKLTNSHPDKAKEIRVLWTSPLIPGDPLVWRSDLPQETRDKIAKFIFSFGVSGPKVQEDKKILQGLGWAPFKPATNDHSIPIRQLELFKDRLKVAADASLNEQDKKAKLAKIDASLEKLNARAAALQKNS